MTPPSECPVCGASVPPKARACPNCGADERTGWNEESTRYDGLDLPAEAFDDHEARRTPKPKTASVFWWIVAAGLLLLFLAAALGLA